MKLLNTIRKTKNFDVYQPWGRSGRINPFYIDHWLETFEDELPYRICIIRDFDLLNNDEWEEVIEYLSLAYRKILVCSEGITSLEPLGWSRMPKMFDSVIWINNERPVPEHYEQEFYWPAHWFRTIQFYSKSNPKVFNEEKIYKSSLRIKNRREWKDKLLKSIQINDLFDSIKLAISHRNPFVPDSPCFFSSEGEYYNEEYPSREQCQSFSLIVSETSEVQITEKTWQALYHQSPIFFHTGPVIQKLREYGFTIDFEGMEIDYDVPDVTNILVDTLHDSLPEIENIFRHNKIKSFENYKKVSDINHFNNLFKPLFFDKL